VEDITAPPDDLWRDVNGTSKTRKELKEQNKSGKFLLVRRFTSSCLYNIEAEQRG